MTYLGLTAIGAGLRTEQCIYAVGGALCWDRGGRQDLSITHGDQSWFTPSRRSRTPQQRDGDRVTSTLSRGRKCSGPWG